MKNLKHISLFENFNESEDEKSKAMEALESLVLKLWPDHEYYSFKTSPKAGDYELDDDTDGDGTKYVFANIYLEKNELDQIEDMFQDGKYDEYVDKLNDALKDIPGGYEVHDVGTAYQDGMISISIAYEPSFAR